MDHAATFHQAQIYPLGSHPMGFNQLASSQKGSVQYALNQHHLAVNHQQVDLPVDDPPTPHAQANHPAVLTLGTITVNMMDEDVKNMVREAADVLYPGHGQCKRYLPDENSIERRYTARV